MNTYTNEQLKQTLAKMLPEKIKLIGVFQVLYLIDSDNEQDGITAHKVLDTELLHLCWLVEEGLSEDGGDGAPHQRFVDELTENFHEGFWKAVASSTWQQRTIALAKILNIEIV